MTTYNFSTSEASLLIHNKTVSVCAYQNNIFISFMHLKCCLNLVPDTTRQELRAKRLQLQKIWLVIELKMSNSLIHLSNTLHNSALLA